MVALPGLVPTTARTISLIRSKFGTLMPSENLFS